MHVVNIKSEHREFRDAVGVCEADRVSESGADVVLGNHDDMPSVPRYVLDDHQVCRVCSVAVTVVVAENTAAFERITGHVVRLR